jgi:hypothetical protein
MSESQLLTALDHKIDAMRRDLGKLVSLAEERRSRAELMGWFWKLMFFNAAASAGVIALVNALMRR